MSHSFFHCLSIRSIKVVFDGYMRHVQAVHTGYFSLLLKYLLNFDFEKYILFNSIFLRKLIRLFRLELIRKYPFEVTGSTFYIGDSGLKFL